MKKFRDMALFLLIILSISIIVIGFTYRYNLTAVNKTNKVQTVVISKNDTIDDIITLLKKKDLIRNPKVFKIYLSLNHIDSFNKGSYKLKDSMTSQEIVNILTKNKN